MKLNIWLFILLILNEIPTLKANPLSDCVWCGAAEAPLVLSSKAHLAPANEPGEPIRIEGQVFLNDKQTPAAGVLIYLYHTNAQGEYLKKDKASGNARRHGHLRGWLLTDNEGRYVFSSIRPNAYPGRKEPAHVHMTIKLPEKPEFWIDSIMFAGDPLITNKILKQQTGIGGPGIITLSRDKNNIWQGKRDIYLP